MSTKNSLKSRIKKPNATQAFFNSYDTDKDNTDNVSNDEKKDTIIVENKTNDAIKEVINNNSVDNELNKTYDNKNNENEIYNIVNDDSNEIDEVNDYLRELATGKKPIKKKNKKVFTSFYMDPDLAVEVDKIASRGEKGDKSKLINLGIRKLLEEYGVIEKK